MKDGFLVSCRRIIGLDGCFLKNTFGGQLLTAMGRDGNDNMFPMAIAVVEAKRYDSWKWFLMELKTEFGVENGAPWTFISDRQKGLVSAIDDMFPESGHRYCLRHIFQNFKQKFKGKELKEYFWAAASAGNIHDFRTAMAELERADPKVGEAMNAAAREFTIISMFEWIRRKLMQRLNVKKEGMQKYQGNLCPNIQERLEKNKLNSRFSIAHYSRDTEYEMDCGTRGYVVDITRRTCTCGLWQLTGIPYSHSIAAIQRDKSEPERYVDPCYSKEAYLNTYNYTIAAIPKKVRRREAAEVRSTTSTRKGLVVHCKKCFRPGHNLGLVNSQSIQSPGFISNDVANAGNARNDVANEMDIAGNATSIGSVSQQGSVTQLCATSAAEPVLDTRRSTSAVEPILDTRRSTRVRKLVPTVASVLENLTAKRAKRV